MRFVLFQSNRNMNVSLSFFVVLKFALFLLHENTKACHCKYGRMGFAVVISLLLLAVHFRFVSLCPLSVFWVCGGCLAVPAVVIIVVVIAVAVVIVVDAVDADSVVVVVVVGVVSDALVAIFRTLFNALRWRFCCTCCTLLQFCCFCCCCCC